MPDSIQSIRDESVMPMIDASHKAFERDLDVLLQSHYREWVAYHGDERLGFAASQTALYAECLRRGLRDDEFVVRSIEPLLPDEEIVFPADS